MIHILIYIVGIYSNIQFILNFLKLGACAGNPQDRRGTLRKVVIYGIISFVFNMLILGRIIAFIFALSLFIATLSITIIAILTVLSWVAYIVRNH
jgi:hypothetical protein